MLGHAGPSTHTTAGRSGKRKRTLKEEIDHWERDEASAAKEVGSNKSYIKCIGDLFELIWDVVS